MVSAALSLLPENVLSRNPIVYFLLTDRFHAAGGAAWPVSTGENVGKFHGGNFSGITEKIHAGWFGALGVNAIWISAPYQQILGPATVDPFEHYAYHGYWPLDFTVPDARFGTGAEFGAMVDAAHAAGIRVVLDVVMSHPGYFDPPSLRATCADGALAEPAALRARWWGSDWVCMPGEGDTVPAPNAPTPPGHGLARFRTESEHHVTLPAFLAGKADSGAVHEDATTVRGYLIGWLSAWVRTYGIDGFRCDSGKHVDLRTWRELKQACVTALADWKARHPAKRIDQAPFWMTGEVFGNGIARNDYHDSGFDSLINFSFQHEIATIFGDTDTGEDYPRSLALHRLDRLYARYATTLAAGHQVLSYLSSHDTVLCDQARTPYAAAALMLAPGGVQIFYGDESGRQHGPDTPVDPAQAARSDMNWTTLDPARLAHWRRLGQFRSRHPAIATGVHTRLCVDPYVFSRTLPDGGDAVLVVLGHIGALDLLVESVFEEGTCLRDAYGRRHYTVCGGRVQADIDSILLLERA